jgi:hypothetical protein
MSVPHYTFTKTRRRKTLYNSDEMKQIIPFREPFINARNVQERMTILQNDILPALFNFRQEQGTLPTEIDILQSMAKVNDFILA